MQLQKGDSVAASKVSLPQVFEELNQNRAMFQVWQQWGGCCDGAQAQAANCLVQVSFARLASDFVSHSLYP